MKRKTKWKFVALLGGILVLAGCTNSFCTVQDKAHMMVNFETATNDEGKTNLEVIIDTVNENESYFAPSDEYFTYVEERVASIVIDYYSLDDLNRLIELLGGGF